MRGCDPTRSTHPLTHTPIPTPSPGHAFHQVTHSGMRPCIAWTHTNHQALESRMRRVICSLRQTNAMRTQASMRLWWHRWAKSGGRAKFARHAERYTRGMQANEARAVATPVGCSDGHFSPINARTLRVQQCLGQRGQACTRSMLRASAGQQRPLARTLRHCGEHWPLHCPASGWRQQVASPSLSLLPHHCRPHGAWIQPVRGGQANKQRGWSLCGGDRRVRGGWCVGGVWQGHTEGAVIQQCDHATLPVVAGLKSHAFPQRLQHNCLHEAQQVNMLRFR